MKKLIPLFLGALIIVGCGSTKNIPTQSASTTYQVGDAYNQNGLKGIVVQVDATGMHGTIMSLEASDANWTSGEEYDNVTNAFYEDEGQKNMDAIAKYIATGKASWDNFPLMNWARSLGDGWYIPAKNEAMQIWININGGADAYKWNPRLLYGLIHKKNDFEAFEKKQKEYGGAKLINSGYFGDKAPYRWMTSTEGDGGMVYFIQFEQTLKNLELRAPGTSSKFGTYLNKKRTIGGVGVNSRAIHKF